jgi:HEAT repeat protein
MKSLKNKDSFIREAAVDALEWIGGDRAIQTIKDALSDYDEGEIGVTP